MSFITTLLSSQTAKLILYALAFYFLQPLVVELLDTGAVRLSELIESIAGLGFEPSTLNQFFWVVLFLVVLMKRPPASGAALSIAAMMILPVSANAQAVRGKVVAVYDGDTVELRTTNTAFKVRLASIDAPEVSQRFGLRSRDTLAALCLNDSVTVRIYTIDRYSRAVCDLYTLTGDTLTRIMVLSGYAWHYKQYSRDAGLTTAENSARIARRGLWSDQRPTPPWIYRHRQRRYTAPTVRPDSSYVERYLNARPSLGIPFRYPLPDTMR